MKKAILFFLLTGIILLGGQCAQKQTTTTGPFVGGSNGVSVNFDTESGAPPAQFDVADTVPLRFILKNNGEYDVPSGEAKVRVEGVLLSAFGLPESYTPTTGPLRGISKFISEGEEQRVGIGNINYKESVTREQEFTLIGKVCYPYETNSQLKVCMGKTTNKDAICPLTGEKLASGSVSSAPVQITSITQEPYATNKVLLKITIENKGKGKSYSNDNSCGNIASTTDENVIDMELNEGISCRFLEGESNRGKVKLSAGRTGKTAIGNILTCEAVAEDTGSNYEQQLNIKLGYKYIDTTSTKIKIIGTS